MQIFLLIYYFFRSVFLRGPLGTFRLLAAEARYEKKFQIETAKVKTSSSKKYYHYQGASYKVLFRIFEAVAGFKNYAFVDIGCGKGRVLFFAAHSGFKDIRGVELDRELAELAVKNTRPALIEKAGISIEVEHANALDYSYRNRPTVYFFFNPFDEEVLRSVVKRIKSAASCETIFVYMNPLYSKVFEEEKMERYRVIRTGFYTEAIIYKLPAASHQLI